MEGITVFLDLVSFAALFSVLVVLFSIRAKKKEGGD